MSKEIKKLARAVALQEYYARMNAHGYKKYGMLLKIETIAKIDVIADELNIPKYQLIDKILTDYIESITKKEE